MPDYSKGRIYTIRCHSNTEYIYVGSTTQPLSKRWGEHKSMSKIKENRLIYSTINNDWDNWYIELYEEYPCENKEQLDKKEGEVIREIGTLNMYIAGRTKEERCQNNLDMKKEYDRQYYLTNTDKIKRRVKEYNEENLDKIREYKKEYQEKNADKIKEYNKNNADKMKEQAKEYRKNNADKIKEQMKEYRKNNADKINESEKQYRQNNADKIKERKKEYYQRKKLEKQTTLSN